mgnify:CR=1 FL=1
MSQRASSPDHGAPLPIAARVRRPSPAARWLGLLLLAALPWLAQAQSALAPYDEVSRLTRAGQMDEAIARALLGDGLDPAAVQLVGVGSGPDAMEALRTGRVHALVNPSLGMQRAFQPCSVLRSE